MAQLTDDCFAFSGPLLADRRDGAADRRARHAGRRNARRWRWRKRAGACSRTISLRRSICRHSIIPPWTALRCATPISPPTRDTRLTIVDRVTRRPRGAPRAAAGAGDPHLHRRADAGGRRHGVHAGGLPASRASGGRAAGAWTRRQQPARRRGCARRRRDAAGRPAARRAGSRARRGAGPDPLAVRRRLRVAVFSTGDEMVEPGTVRRGAAIFDANRHLLRGLLEQFGAEVTDLGILRDEPAALRSAIAAAAADHDLVITSGGVSTGEADHVRAAVEAIGRLVFWRVAIKPGRPVAMGVMRGCARRRRRRLRRPAGKSGRGLRHLRARGVAAAAAARRRAPRPPLALPVRATFAYRKRRGRREYVRVTLRAGRRRRGRGGEISPRRRRRDHLAHRNRRPRRTRRGGAPVIELGRRRSAFPHTHRC